MITIGIDGRVLQGADAGGIREYATQLLDHMVPLDRTVRFVVITAGTRQLPQATWQLAPNVSVRNVARSGRALIARTWMTGRPYVDRMIGGADAFFFPHFLLAATSPGVRRVMTWHDLSYELMPQYLSVGRRLWHQLQMRPRMQAHRADAIIAVSRATAADVAAWYGIPSERISVIHSGVAPEVRRADPVAAAAWRARNRLPEQYVLMLGVREPRKNIEGGIRAWQMARRTTGVRIPLVIAGPPGWSEPALSACIPDGREREQVMMLGPIAQYERGLLLSGARVLVYPSFMEGFGFPPLEAMACGVPVVASANSSIAEVCGDAAVLVSPYRMQSVASGLAAVLTDQSLSGRLAARGYERAARYTWADAARRTLDVIIDAL